MTVTLAGDGLPLRATPGNMPGMTTLRAVGRQARGGLIAVVATTALLVASPAPARAQYVDPTPPWPELLPPAPTSGGGQPGPVPGCDPVSLTCLERVVRRIRALRDRLGCDHRAVFATTYLIVTETVMDTLRRDPDFFDDRMWLIVQDVIFADYWFGVLAAAEAGRPVPEAWRTAFETAAHGDANAGQDLLLGINAHVQRDQPFVVAEVGLATSDGHSRKPDHDRFNQILRRAYDPIVREIGRRYDPLVTTTNASWHPVDDVAGLEAVAGWREGVWRHAEQLVASSTPQQRARVAQRIEANAQAWAESIAGAPQQPGYRAVRDAYCRARMARFGTAAGESVTSNRLRLGARRRCSDGALGAVVSGRGIRRVTYSVGGRRLGTVRAPDRRGRWRRTARVRLPGAGRQHLRARVQLVDGTTVVLRRAVRDCPRDRGRGPRFTG